MITVLLTRGGGQDGIYLKLPAPQSEIDAAFSELDAIEAIWDSPTSVRMR